MTDITDTSTLEEALEAYITFEPNNFGAPVDLQAFMLHYDPVNDALLSSLGPFSFLVVPERMKEKTAKMVAVEKDEGKPLDVLLKTLYQTEGLSSTEIAERWGLGPRTVLTWLRYFDLEVRTQADTILGKSGATRPTKEQLHRWYKEEGLGTVLIGRRCGVGSSTVSTWLRKEGIATRPQKTVWPEKKVLEEWYHTDDRSIREIALELGVGRTTLRSHLIEVGVPIKDRAEVNRRKGKAQGIPAISEADLRRMHYEEGRSSREIARNLSIGTSTVNRWMRGYGMENSRHVQWPERKVLAQWYEIEGLSLEAVGERVGTAGQTVRKHLLGLGFTLRGVSEARLVGSGGTRPDRATLERLYSTEQQSTVAIAEQYGVTSRTILNWIKEEGIPYRDVSAVRLARHGGRRPDARELRAMLFTEGLTRAQMAKRCGVYRTTIGNWLDSAGIDKEQRKLARQLNRERRALGTGSVEDRVAAYLSLAESQGYENLPDLEKFLSEDSA